VGSGAPIGDGAGAGVTITSTGTTTFGSTLETASGIVQSDVAGRVTFLEDVIIAAGDTGTTLSGNVTLDGLTFESAGAVTFGNTVSDEVILTGGAVRLRSDAGTTWMVEAKLVGAGGLTKDGSGVLALTAPNIYSGGTMVDGGTLLVNNEAGSGTGTGGVVVNVGGVLGGDGSIGGPVVIVNSGGTVSPGQPGKSGTLTVRTIAFAAGATLSLQLDGTEAGVSYDQLVVNGGVSLARANLTAALSFRPQPWEAQFIILRNASSQPVEGTFAETQLELNGQLYQVLYNRGESGLDVALESLGFVAAFRATPLETPRGIGAIAGPPPAPLPPSRPLPPAVTRPVESGTTGGEVPHEAGRAVEVRIVIPTDDEGGVREETVLRLPLSVLRDPARLYAELPDDRYRLYVVLLGSKEEVFEERLVQEVFLRDGKPTARRGTRARPVRPGPAAPSGEQPRPDPGPSAALNSRRASAAPPATDTGAWAGAVDDAIARHVSQLLTKAVRLARCGRT
jgi:autotransporter-associated beta strand protein